MGFSIHDRGVPRPTLHLQNLVAQTPSMLTSPDAPWTPNLLKADLASFTALGLLVKGTVLDPRS